MLRHLSRSCVRTRLCQWGVLLDPTLPLGIDWTPADMMRLRGVCSSLRGATPAGQFFAQVLETLGVRVRWYNHAPERLFTAASRIFTELTFVYSCRHAAARAAGLRADEPLAHKLVCVAGSYALHRSILLGTTAQSTTLGSKPVGWAPGDIDVFVGSLSTSERSQKAFDALVEHAKQTIDTLWKRPLKTSHSSLPFWLTRGFGVSASASVSYSRQYGQLGGLPSSVESAMRSQGMRYPRHLAVGCADQQTEVWPAQSLKAAIEALPQTLVRAPRWIVGPLGHSRPA